MNKYTIGLDFGTLSGRAVLVNVATGEELASSEFVYPHGVMDEQLPCGKKLGSDWALEHPQDYLDVLSNTIPQVLKDTGAEKAKLTKGMIITKFEGITIESMEELSMQLSYYKIGEEIELIVQIPVNGGAYEEQSVMITLGKAVE